MRRFLAAALFVAGLPVAALASSGSPPTGRDAPVAPPRFGGRVDVRLFTVVVRVVDGAGNPVLGLKPEDFRARVGKKEVPVAAVDWISSEGAPAAEESPGGAAAPGSPAPAAPPPAAPAPSGPAGKLVVLFVQADNNDPGRTRGHLRTLQSIPHLLAALQPSDLVAVVAFDSHLKLWLDFTRDREPVPTAVYRAIRFGGHPPELRGGGGEPASLAPHFDLGKALRAASTERGLEVTAEALARLPGEKVMVLLGWGLGNFGPFGTEMTPAFAPAVRALGAARVTVFVLDVTDADAHDLEVGLRGIAEATGGTYDKTNIFPTLAVRHLARAISGYYVLSFDPDTLPRRGGPLEIDLRDRRHRRGTVLVRPTAVGVD
ncbi:MAG TPA: VWA domain-containing protein [Thermoanaerobaculia bacterium]|nr:VWA domain-containing protein [Thermoanaerobaculia bacterium]